MHVTKVCGEHVGKTSECNSCTYVLYSVSAVPQHLSSRYRATALTTIAGSLGKGGGENSRA